MLLIYALMIVFVMLTGGLYFLRHALGWSQENASLGAILLMTTMTYLTVRMEKRIAQKKHHKNMQALLDRSILTPEISTLFERMLNVNPPNGQMPQHLHRKDHETAPPEKPPSQQEMDDDVLMPSFNLTFSFSQFILPQLSAAFPSAINKHDTQYPFKETYAYLLTNKKALGYLFGACDYFAQHAGLHAQGEKTLHWAMALAYDAIWRTPNGQTMHSHALSLQNDKDFSAGKMQGSHDARRFMANGMRLPETACRLEKLLIPEA